MTATWRILEGDCRTMLRTLPERSVQTCVTSPPYFGLRDYGHGGQIGLEPAPDEFVQALVSMFREVRRVLRDDGTIWCNLGDSYAPEKQLQGIPWRFAFAMQADGWVLRSDVVWAKPNPMPESVTDRPTKSHEFIFMFAKGRERAGRFAHISDEDARWLALFVDTEGCITVKRTREVCGAQVSVAGTCRALLERAQAIVGAGNILEREGQNAPMFYWQVSNKAARDLLLRLYPHLIVKQRQARICLHIESMTGRSGEAPSDRRAAVLDRLWEANKSCNSFGDPDISWVPEPNVFLLSKGPRYWYDADAIREDVAPSTIARDAYGYSDASGYHEGNSDPKGGGLRGLGGLGSGRTLEAGALGRNKRSVWTVATQPYPGAHFATFPAKLIEPCILAGCPERACSVCGVPWTRIVERTAMVVMPSPKREAWQATDGHARTQTGGTMLEPPSSRTVGWEPSCGHDASTVPGVVLDPFAGAGTTGVVALRHNRSFIGIELNPEYVELARDRIIGDAPLLNSVAEAA